MSNYRHTGALPRNTGAPPPLMPDESPSVFERLNVGRFDVIKLVVTLAIAAAISYGTITSSQTQRDGRIEANSLAIKSLSDNIVPRKEHEEHWKAFDDKLNSIQLDVRELRNAQTQQTQLLLSLSRGNR